MRTIHSMFVALSAISIPLLWLPMLLNGTLDDISWAIANNVLPDGTPLKTTYSGIPVFDNLISILVAFFYALANGSYLGPRLMLTDLGATLHVALGWMVIESIRNGKKPWYLGVPALFGVFWNVAGAGIVLPIFSLLHLQTTVNDHSISISHAKSLVPAMLVSSIPLWMMILAPARAKYSADQHQNTILVFQFAPVIWIVAQYTFSFLLSRIDPTTETNPNDGSRTGIAHASTEPYSQRKQRSDTYIMTTHLFFAFYSAVIHLICIFTCLFSSDPSVTILRVFVPNPNGVHRDSPERLTQAAILFLQYDWLVICLTAVLYSYLLLEPDLTNATKQVRWKGTQASSSVRFLAFLLGNPLSRVIALVLITVLLGPSTSVSIALWQREKHLVSSCDIVDPEDDGYVSGESDDMLPGN